MGRSWTELLRLDLTADEKHGLLAFLRSLSGNISEGLFLMHTSRRLSP